MNDNAIVPEIAGLKCDADGCDYRDMSISVEDYEKYINAPCPECGSNLLTEADYKLTHVLLATASWLNATIKPSGDDSPKVNMQINMNGSGFIDSVDVTKSEKG